MAKTPSWQHKLLDEPRMGFVEELRARTRNANGDAAIEEQASKGAPVAKTKQYDPLAKILNETRVGFDSIRWPRAKARQ